MADTLIALLDPAADTAIRNLWASVDAAGVPSPASRGIAPHVVLAAGASIPAVARRELRQELMRLTLPRLWLHSLGTFPDAHDRLVLGAVVDAELLAVHGAVHDSLAGVVRGPSAYHLPGAWVPQCALTSDVSPARLVAAFAALHPVTGLGADIAAVAVLDGRAGTLDRLLP